MGFLDDLKSKATDAIQGASGKLGDFKLGKRQSDDDDDAMDDDAGNSDYEQILNDEIKPQRSDVLELLGVPDDYEVPDEVLLVGDLDRVRFDMTEPSGYSTKMVDAFFETVYDSLVWYRDTLKKRNRDVAKLATQLDKSATDLHNAKINAEMSDGLTVMTGQESTAEQELQELQLAMIKLRDENEKLKKMVKNAGPGAGASAPDSRYDELQNQYALAQLEIKKLTAQLKRQNLEQAVTDDASLDLSDHIVPPSAPMPDDVTAAMNGGLSAPSDGMPAPGGMPSPTPATPGGMPSPFADAQGGAPGSMPDPFGGQVAADPSMFDSSSVGSGTVDFAGRANEGYTNRQSSQQQALEDDADFDVDFSPTGLQGGPGDDYLPAPNLNDGDDGGFGYDQPFSPSPDDGGMPTPSGFPVPSLPSDGMPAPSNGGMPMPGSNGVGDASGNGMPMPGGMPAPSSASQAPNAGGMPMPGSGDDGMSSTDYLPLPNSMGSDEYDELGIDIADGSGEIDMSKML